ncbi:mariner transposase [Trichonephila clavipes]|nr:mariner transposase [Trichonephila clavipes]
MLNQALPEQDLTFDDYVLVDTDIAVWGALSDAEIVALDHNNTETLAKQNEIDPFLKRMATGDEKWVTCDNIVRKRSWSKRGEAAQMVVKLGLTARKDLLCI